MNERVNQMKNTWKRLGALFLAVAMTLTLLPTAAFAAGGVSTQADGELTIPGYTRVTKMPAGGLEAGKYLIIAPYTHTVDGAEVTEYYMLYPGTTGAGNDAHNSAKLEVGDDGVAEGYYVRKNTSGDRYAGASLVRDGFSAADNTITKTGETYSVTAKNGDYSLYSNGSGNWVYQDKSKTSSLTISTTDAAAGCFRINSTGGYLILYVTNMNFDGAPGTNTNYLRDMMLFKSLEGHIEPLKYKVLSGFTGWSKTGSLTIDDDSLSFTSAGNNIAAYGEQLTVDNFLISFDMTQNFDSASPNVHPRVIFKADGTTATSMRLQLRFDFQNSKMYLERTNLTGETGVPWRSEGQSFTWTKGQPLGVDILVNTEENTVTVYLDGDTENAWTVTDVPFSAVTGKYFAMACQYPNQNLTITNFKVTTDEGEDPVPPYTDENIAAGVFDVGAEYALTGDNTWTATYSNPSDGVADSTSGNTVTTQNGTVIKATAASWADVDSWNDRYPYFAVNNSSGKSWHSRYSNGTHANPYGPTDLSSDVELRYLQLEIVAGPEWLDGFRYLPKNGSGDVNQYEIKTSDDGENWVTVATGNFSRTGWQTATFDQPVYTKYVRLYGVTIHAGVNKANDCMSANEVRLVKANPEEVATSYTLSGVVTQNDADPVEGALVTVAGRTAETGSNGRYSIEKVLPGTYTVNASATVDGELVLGEADVTVEAANVTDADINITVPSSEVTGTITDETANGALDGATVTLVKNDDGRTTVANVKAATGNDGAYTLDLSGQENGEYRIRVSKTGYNAVIGETKITVQNGKAIEGATHNDAAIAQVNPGNKALFAYDMTDAEDKRPTLGISTATNHPEASYTDDGELKLAFKNINRSDNLVKLLGTNLRNGTIEFDARREGEKADEGRFGLALRLTDNNHWIYVGLNQSSGAWFHEYWNGSGVNDWGSNKTGIAFGNGDTRHFKVTIQGTKLSLEIDGKPVLTESNLGTEAQIPMTAADVGFICGNNGNGVPCEVYIDNLYIFSSDPYNDVTLSGESAAVQLDAKIDTSAGPMNLPQGKAPAGNTIIIKAAEGTTIPNNKALYVTVTDADGAAVATQHVEDADGDYYTFVMPDSAVTVTGSTRNTFTIELPEDGPKVGDPYTVTIMDGETKITDLSKFTINWYEVNGTDESPLTADTDKPDTYTPVQGNLGRTIRVEVTGIPGSTAEGYVGTRTETSTNDVAEGDTQVTDVDIHRPSVTMYLNDEGDAGDDTIDGNEIELTAYITPSGATNPTVAWTVTKEDGTAFENGEAPVTVAGGTDVTVTEGESPDTATATVTAVKNGTAKVTVTVTSANTTTVTDSCVITVKTMPTGITVSTGEGDKNTVLTGDNAETLILYTNASSDETPNSAELTAELTAGDDMVVSEDLKGLTWAITEYNGVDIEVTANEDDPTKATINVLSTSNMDNVGEVTVTVTSTADDTVVETFKVIVKRRIERNIQISGTPKYGEELSWSFETNVNGNASLTYQWYRLDKDAYEKRGDATLDSLLTDEAKIEGASGKSTGAGEMLDVGYTIKAEADIESYIAVKVSPAEGTEEEPQYYEGEKIAVTAAVVAKADAPAAPTLRGSRVNADDASATGSITIVGCEKAYSASESPYQYRLAAAEGGQENTWVNAEVKALDTVDGKTTYGIDGLTVGTYEVCIAETATQKASPAAKATVLSRTEDLFGIDYHIENGTSSGPSSAAAGDSITITVTPDEGYKLAEDGTGAVKVTYTVNDEEKTADLTPVDGQEGQYTFEMPNADVTISAEFTIKKVTISHTLTHLTCSLKPADADEAPDSHTVDYGGVTEITLTPDEGYSLPDTIEVKHGETECKDYRYVNGVIIFAKGGLTEDVTITASGVPEIYAVRYTLTNLTSGSPRTATYGKAYNGQLTAATGYSLPETITVTMDGEEQTAVYNKEDGTITIGNVTGAIEISAQGVKNTTEVTGVTINIRHSDSNISTSQKDTPHVGDILSAAAVTPTGATVSYEWFTVKDGNKTKIEGENSVIYTVTQADLDNAVSFKVKVTGVGDYSGEAESTVTQPVGVKVVPTTDVSVSPNEQQFIIENETVTLTATVYPSTASQTVTWTVEDANGNTLPASQDFVELTENEDGSVTVKGLKPGTVRVVATNDGGQTARCTVTVERGNQHTLAWNVWGLPQGAEVKFTVDGEEVVSGSGVVAGDTVTATVTFAEAGKYAAELAVTSDGQNVTTNKAADSYTWTFVMPTDDASASVTITRVPVRVTRVTLDQTSVSVPEGNSVGIMAHVEPSDADNPGLVWISNDEDVATVSQQGVITGVAKGTTTITVTSADNSEIEATCTVEVTDPPAAIVPVTSVAITQGSTAEVFVGDTIELSATVGPNEATNKDINWSSSNTKIATVSKAGVVTGRAAGLVTITAASAAYPNVKATCTVTVKSVLITAVQMDANVTVEAGASVPLTCRIEPLNATNKILTWTIDDETKATVTQDGLLTGVAEGTATLTVAATDGSGIRRTCTVTVSPQSKAMLSDLSLSDGYLVPDFVNGVFEYNANVDNSVSSVTVTAVGANGATAVVKKDGTACAGGVVELEVGQNEITVTVSKDGLGSRDYTVTVTRAAQVDTTALESAIVTARAQMDRVVIGTTESEVAQGTEFVTQADMTALETAIAAAETAVANAATQADVTAALTALNTAVGIFEEAIKTGTNENAPKPLTGTVTIGGTPKYGQQLTAIVTGITPAEARDGLTYQWKRNGTDITGTDEATYTLTADDINATITVTVSAGAGYTGSKTSEPTAAVAKADGPAAPDVTVDNDGRITGLESGKTYEIRRKIADDPVDWGGWSDATVTGNVIAGLAPGTYEIRVKETATHEAGTAAPVEIPDHVETYDITVNVTHGTYSGDATVAEGGTANVTVRANTEFTLPETITVTAAGYTYNKATGEITITNATGDVTITVVCAAVSAPPPQGGPIGGGILTPPTTTTVVENPDGSTTTTVTDNRTGTVTETTEKEDGTVETVETKKDGTVTETTKNTDGSTEVVETKPDGTVTATTTDAEGGKVEKITTPDEDVTITVTDKDGEELAKVEIPAEIPASPIEFVDVPEGHWAEDAINQAAGLGLVQGVGDNLFDLNGDMVRGDLALVLYNLSNGSEGYEVTFDDVPADAYYAESVAWAVATGVVKGYSETEFGPKDNITREELAVMLYRYAKLLKLDTAASADALDAFNDGSSVNSWAEDGMAWCVENEIIKGKGDDTLDPGANASRAEVTVMLQRFMNLMK